MANRLTIMDWNRKKVKTDVDLDRLSEICRIDIDVISGDEIATVIYKDGRRERYDSSDDRLIDYYDLSYCLYSEYERINNLTKFKKRKNSYDVEDIREVFGYEDD